MSAAVEVLPYIEGAKDDHGNPTKEWQDPGNTQSVYGWGPPQDSSEPSGSDSPGRSAVLVDLDVYTLPGFVVGPHDRVRVSGRVYEVVGELSDFNNGPFGYTPGGRVSLKLVVG